MVALQVFPMMFQCEARTAMVLPPMLGPTLRGAVLEGLFRCYCANPMAPSCRACSLHDQCPVSRLVATVRDAGERGMDVPRPFVLRPPQRLGPRLLPGHEWQFGLTLLGHAGYLPYLLHAFEDVGQSGIGSRAEVPGRFTVESVWSLNEISGTARRLWDRNITAEIADAEPVCQESLLTRAERLASAKSIRLRFLTPMRLVTDGHLVHTFLMEPFMRRILRRLTDLQAEFCAQPLVLDFPFVLAQAEDVRVIREDTHWVDIESHSRRTGRNSPIGGIVGSVILGGAWQPLVPWLLWAQLVGVGKDVTKGNGWLRVEAVHDNC